MKVQQLNAFLGGAARGQKPYDCGSAAGSTAERHRTCHVLIASPVRADARTLSYHPIPREVRGKGKGNDYHWLSDRP